MAQVTDEELMQFADRTLSAAEHARIAGLVADDPAARARLAHFTETGRVLSDPYSAIVNAPVPQHLVDLVMGRPVKHAARTRRVGETPRASLMEFLGNLLPLGPAVWRPAFAAAVLVAGGVIGWYAHGVGAGAGAGEILSLQNGRILAEGTLLTALETAASGQKVVGSDKATASVQVRLTFRNRGQSYCRQYEITQRDGGALAGVGCRAPDGRWIVEFHAPTAVGPSASTQSVPADDAKAALAGVVDGMKDGDAFGREEEADALARKWQR